MAKKKKRKLNKNAKIAIILVLLIIVVFAYVPVTSKIKIRIKGYSRHSVTMIYNKNLTKDILDRDYNEFIDKTVDSDDFNKDYLDKYYEINYHDKDNYLNEINTFINKEY